MGLPFRQIENKEVVHYTVEAILEGIKTSDHIVLKYIYRKYYPVIRFFIIKNSGSDEDAKDIFQESLILIYNKLKKGTLVLDCSFKTYLYSVCRLLWLKNLEQQQIKRSLHDSQDYVQLDSSLENEYVEQERYRLYQKHFKTLSKDCQKVLKLALKEKSFTEIARKMKYKSEKYVKKRKFECKERLIKRIQNDPDYRFLSNYKL